MVGSTFTLERKNILSAEATDSSVDSLQLEPSLSIIEPLVLKDYYEEQSSEEEEYKNKISSTGYENRMLISVENQVKIRSLPTKPKRRTSNIFKVQQKWQGTIIEIEGDTITAHIYDLLSDDSAREEITFDMMEVQEGDKSLVVQGAVFYWIIGYEDSKKGRRRVAKLRFRRRIGWTSQDLQRQRSRSRSLIELIQSGE